jgi:uncharacterized protein (TIGR02594 family)
MSFKTVQPGDPAWLKDAFSHLGLAEIPGVEHNQVILDMFAEVGFPEVDADETSWCAAFANWVAKRAGLPVTGKLTARSFLDWGEDDSADPKRGDFVVIKRGTEGWQGHVFLWLGEDGDHVWGIGGNQGKVGAVTVSPFKKASVVGIRRPPPLGSVATPAAPPVGEPREVYPASLVKAIQEALWAKGYTAVGLADGEYGTDTGGAISAFQIDHKLPLTGKPSPELLASILEAAPKQVSEVRAGASPAEVRETVPEIKKTWWAQVVALWGMVASAIGGVFSFVTGNVQQARDQVAPLLDMLGDIPPWAYIAAVAGGLLFLWLQTRSASKAQVAAFKSGARR